MKIDWRTAPEWANYIAMDDNGQWYWYEREPEQKDDYWNNRFGKAELVGEYTYWKDSLQERPIEILEVNT